LQQNVTERTTLGTVTKAKLALIGAGQLYRIAGVPSVFTDSPHSYREPTDTAKTATSSEQANLRNIATGPPMLPTHELRKPLKLTSPRMLFVFPALNTKMMPVPFRPWLLEQGDRHT
jgi:hypothetical protein